MSLTAIRIPLWIHLKAINVLQAYRRHKLITTYIHTTGYLSLKVNRRWRLLSRDNGRNWEVMSHERYNKEKDRRK
ncbi:hypothetical protein QQF54_08535 [Lelliottia sp. V106_10]|uniref:ParE family toxin-like protein n=1 Tax=Lelliottia wanjuensis TaxID=3050585 RepID=UPI00254DF962|nr:MULTISPECIES: hypothetical protein [unclassified Lelliottia]MDK9373400.1 hypothetical protein [Lelliottia sp. V106_10]MDK9600193.1 hypothetical protein [Lelliottia sp. V106_5]